MIEKKHPSQRRMCILLVEMDFGPNVIANVSSCREDCQDNIKRPILCTYVILETQHLLDRDPNQVKLRST